MRQRLGCVCGGGGGRWGDDKEVYGNWMAVLFICIEARIAISLDRGFYFCVETRIAISCLAY